MSALFASHWTLIKVNMAKIPVQLRPIIFIIERYRSWFEWEATSFCCWLPMDCFLPFQELGWHPKSFAGWISNNYCNGSSFGQPSSSSSLSIFLLEKTVILKCWRAYVARAEATPVVIYKILFAPLFRSHNEDRFVQSCLMNLWQLRKFCFINAKVRLLRFIIFYFSQKCWMDQKL